MSADKTDDISPDEALLLEAMTGEELSAPLTDYVAHAGEPLPCGLPHATREQVIEALKTVSDPEIMINIWDMGLIYDLQILPNADVYIEMTVTAPTCPVAGILPGQAAEAVAALEGAGEVTVKLVWEPAWSFERLSDDAKMMFEMF